MSFSADLLDGFETLYKRTDGTLKSCTEMASFLKNMSKCEKDYAKELKKLASSQKTQFQKCPPMHKESKTTLESWDVVLTELEKIADHHSQFADKLENELVKNILNYVKEKHKTKKKLETDGSRITKDMKAAVENLQKSRGKYVTCSKESEAAEAVHTKGKGDMNIKPSQLAKLAAKATGAADKAAQSDNEYQATLNATNQKQTEYYNTIMPNLLKEFQQFEEERIQNMKDVLSKFAEFTSEKPTIYSASCEAITNAAKSIDVKTDIEVWVGENKTGVSPPADIPYIPFDSDQPTQPNSKPALAKKATAKPIAPGKIGKYKAPDNDLINSKEWGLSAGDQGLSTEEKQSKLRGQIDELEKAIAQETKSKDGLENLVRFYANDPVAQKKAEDQMTESEQRLQRLIEIKNLVQSQSNEVLGGNSSVPHSTSKASTGPIKAKGVYDYAATCDTELSFKEGDILNITEQDESGWWFAEMNGQTGFVPNNYVEVLQ